jgi:predicted flavoprotein YhiN
MKYSGEAPSNTCHGPPSTKSGFAVLAQASTAFLFWYPQYCVEFPRSNEQTLFSGDLLLTNRPLASFNCIESWCTAFALAKLANQFTEAAYAAALDGLANSTIQPSGTLGYNKAEVTLGGVDTRGLSSQTMAANNVPNLYFIGEVVDVTGHLGGRNFQWAWASGHAAGVALAEATA